ncbi:glycoside hydrolase family 3 protein [Nocardioides eburneiflavus]|uniref:beta-N-acetylhexosaminidase n=1 Tax=Nocardioides eburneiflavus TaxID=2518372 RepID=A0A4Z1CML9_9ACTN|nr:glycoside hydrolase family 3 N-terminal domain-containing protein [Nocardioides eburneiflavus]TGN65129.1 glycoside hydrolase family 3 protein [Nocardioides eburneiflavus]
MRSTISSLDLTARPFHLAPADCAWVEDTVSSLSTEEKVGQLLCLYLRTDDVPLWWTELAGHGIFPGGVLVLPRSSAQATRDVAELQRLSPIPMLVAANLESGSVNFLLDTEAFAHPMQIAATGDVRDAVTLARHCARIAHQVGINWAFAPVIDIAMNPGNPITNTRTFGEDPDTVALLGAAYIRELESQLIATSPKHFPGDGVDDRDQHLVTTNNDLDAPRWRATFGAAYRTAIEAGARTIMAAHIRQPALTRELLPGIAPEHIQPATLAPELLGDVLRGELGFNGMIVSDNSAMTGFTAVRPRDVGFPAAVAAGVDMMLGSVTVNGDFQILLRAVHSGVISPDRLDDAVRRVLATKASLGLHRPASRSEVRRAADFTPHEAELRDAELRDDIARRSITLVKDTQRLLPLDPSRHRRALVIVLGDEPTFYDPSGPFAPQFVEGLEARGLQVDVSRVPSNGSDIPAAERLHETYDVCLYFANVRHIGNSNSIRIAWTPWQGLDAPRHVASLPTALVSIADPYLLQDVPMIRTAINAYTPTPSSVEAVLAVLFGEAEPVGRSPVDPFAGRWDAAL